MCLAVILSHEWSARMADLSLCVSCLDYAFHFACEQSDHSHQWADCLTEMIALCGGCFVT